MGWWGRIIGSSISTGLLGIYGFPIGFAIGAMVDSKLEESSEEEKFRLKLSATIDVLSKPARSSKEIQNRIKLCHEALTMVHRNEEPELWAVLQLGLGRSLVDSPVGDRAENIEQGIAAIQSALEVFTRKELPEQWTAAQMLLGSAYLSRIRGDRAKNIEQGIAAIQSALKVFTPDTFPYEWAMTQQNLGVAYIQRIRGKKADNLEAAIACLQESLKVFTPDAFPSEWAKTQDNLGVAYRKRIRGEKADNLETAINCYQESLKVLTPDGFPFEWAMTQQNLGVAYIQRIKEEKADNLETAINCYQESLKVLTPDGFPFEWAVTQQNLGNAYADRIQREKADNLETAITCLQESLKVFTLDDFPFEWAMTQQNLGTAYADRIKGEKADNLETAITCLQESLKVFTLTAFPYDWARTRNNLGAAYRNRIKGGKADNLETAITCLQESLKVYTPDAFPFEWAWTQNNLGTAYQTRIRGEKAANLEAAIACYRESLKVFTSDAFPFDWAITQNNLGTVYEDRIKGEKTANLEAAIACYRESLKVFTSDAFPQKCLLTERNLGDLAFREGNWQLAIEAYNRAITALEISRSWAMTSQSKQEVMEAAIEVYYNIVQAYLNTEQNSLALEYVERSKTRNLVELIATRDLKPRGDFSPYILTELTRLRHEFRTEEMYLSNQERKYNIFSELGQSSPSSLPDRTRLNQLQQKLDELIERDILPIDPTFSLTQKVETIPFSDIKSLINERTAIVEWYITGEKILTFLVTHHRPEPQVWQNSTEDLTKLKNWGNEYLETYYTNRQQWKTNLETSLPKLAEILHLKEILALVPEECAHLILVPHRFLHIFPLHALPVGSQNVNTLECLLDLFPRGVQYAPSCQLLKIAQNQQRLDFRNLFAIQNPTKDLIYTDLEVESIRFFFANAEVLVKQAASEASLKLHENLPLANCVHFSCHGEFNSISPLESALVLSKDEANKEDGKLTLAEIFELSLQQCRLVTLSACETGFSDIRSLSDEYIGLPNGFLFAGSPSIVSSLWTVRDLTTAFLMVKLYENLPQSPQAGEVAISLKEAQKWLRDLTYQEFEQTLIKPQYQKAITQLQQKLSPADFFELEDAIQVERERLKKFDPNHKPFANPYYWAAFVAIDV